MKTVSPNVCASFEIQWIYKIDGEKNTTGMKYLLPSVTLPGGVPTFQTAIDIVSMKKSEKNLNFYDFKLRGSIATVNKLDSTVKRVYCKYITMKLEKLVCNKYLNRIKTFTQSGVGVYSGMVNNMNTFGNRYCFDISAIHSDYPYDLCDKLMAGEMWPENKAPKFSDIEFVVSGVGFDAHRAIVCARSPVFAVMLANEMLDSGTVRVEITDVSVETFRLFLQFLYTGSLDESCFDEKLKNCADKYQVTTLSNLCGGLAMQQDSEKCKVLARSAACKSDRETAIYEEEPTIYEECFVTEFVLESAKVGSNEFCFRSVAIEVLLRSDRSMSFFCWNPNANGLNILGVEYFRDKGKFWKPMQKHDCDPPKSSTYGFPCFNAKDNFRAMSRIHFRVSFKEATEKYKFRLMDRLRGNQLWAAATNRQFTDVEFLVAGESFHAHQAIVAARCPLFEWAVRENYGKYEVIGCDPSAFEQMLFFIYTGGLKAPADSEHLLLLAKKYGIVTLQEICELALEGSFKSFNEEKLLSTCL